MQESVVKVFVRRIRYQGRRLGQKIRYRRLSLNGIPVLFANSFPKSGTHLLTQILEGFRLVGPVVNSGLPAVVTFNGETGARIPVWQIVRQLDQFSGGDTGYGHLHAEPEIVAFLSGERFASIFLLRDPRDVVVSHAHYLSSMAASHIHHKYFAQELSSMDERIRTSITGRGYADSPEERQQFALPDISQRFRPYIDWLNVPGILVLHFEDLIRNIDRSTQQILNHSLQRGFQLHCSHEVALSRIIQSLNPERSPTFRKGSSGEWKNVFSHKNKELFKTIGGDLLIDLGYEKDLNW
jgi:hypothetical protein